MGTASSKFRNHLINGDEFAALQVFQNSNELRKSLDPNCSYGDAFGNSSPLHLVAKHAMKPLLKIFLNEMSGNPNKLNANKATVLHLACQGHIARSPSTRERRAECVQLILNWRGNVDKENGRERVDLGFKDEYGNTALHYAAASGLRSCVEVLVRNNAPLFVENNNHETACDFADRNGHKDIAQFLESNMVFSPEPCSDPNDIDLVIENLEENSGLRPQDLQEAKDHLLVETSDMLLIPLFTAEALLRNHEWSRESLLESWMSDPILCCQKAGVQPPSSALQNKCTDACALQLSCSKLQMEYQRETLNSPVHVPLVKKSEIMCEICVGNISANEEPIIVPCGHQFCQSCWGSYLCVKIQDGEAHSILCPSFECQQLVPIDIIEKIVSPEMVRRYLEFDIEAFVESNPNIKWCPFPGCSRAVKLPDADANPEELIDIPNCLPPAPVSHAVDCGNGHYFCWECLGEAHAPVGCDAWRQWIAKISEIRPEDLRSTCNKTEDAANCLWLVTNSKPCPNCKSPIQKNDGCNHMKCSKCKSDFCWVCLESWKVHSSSTGGYFRCNRYSSVQKLEERTRLLISEAEVKNKEMQDLKRFIHFYTRFKNHENSYKLEDPLVALSKQKIKTLASPTRENQFSDSEAQFLEDAIKELLRARRVLCGSYVYGYYLEDNGYNKTIFEFMQNDLEEATESLSEMVARQYLRSPKSKIIQGAILVRRKRHEFVTAVSKGLVPPETPPSLRKNRKRRYPGVLGMDPVEDEQLTQAIMASLQDMDPNDPWVKDAQGRHTNLPAIFDWPDYDSDEDPASSQTLVKILGVCSREGCKRPRARNPRTLDIHEYCSLRCHQHDKLGLPVSEKDKPEFEIDCSMDMLIALEMSRLQLIEDMRQLDKLTVENATHESDPEVCGGGAEASGSSPIKNMLTIDIEHDQPQRSSNDNIQFDCEIENDVQGATEDNNHTTGSTSQQLEPFEDESILGVDYLTNAKWMSDGNDVSKELFQLFNATAPTTISETSEISDTEPISNNATTCTTTKIAFYMKNTNFNNEVCCKDRNLNTNILDKTSKGMFITGQNEEQIQSNETTEPGTD